MSEPWYWWTVAVLAGLGTALFALSYATHGETVNETPRWATAIGIAGLISLAWGVVLAASGAAFWLASVSLGACVP